MPIPPVRDADPAGPTTWVLDLDLRDMVALPDGTRLDRDALIEWLWSRWGDAGLAGIAEGSAGSAEAAARGLVESPLVLDAAAAPADRDWVRDLGLSTISCWFDDESAAREVAAKLWDAQGCAVAGPRRAAATADGDWKAAFTAIDVPGFGTVRPSWAGGAATAAVGGGSSIFIEPGTGFGTGLHETTQLCLAAIAGWADGGGRMERVLDFGAGSGILGIAAAVLGGADVHSVEVDRSTHDAIAANAARNGVAHRVTVRADLPPAREPYDLVVANIVADVLVRHADDLCQRVRGDSPTAPRGRLVLSGLLADDVAAVEAAYASRLGVRARITTRGDWHCLRFEIGPTCFGDEACR